ncbi:MAG: hypothetical protein MRZ69_08005 [Lachnospiraceae bacterium]|nr:hypothetical protein [Lachnospiraceae bacterium]
MRGSNEHCAEMLAEPLVCDTFHITLHDLANGMRSQELQEKIENSEYHAKQLLGEIKAEDSHRIKLRSTFLFNMMNTSVVLGFAPAEEESCYRLMSLYERFQSVINLSYPLTPHITMAYYKPGRYGTAQLDRLREVIRYVDELGRIELELNAENLAYQCFTDMNHYVIK